jgi:branched-chain amino acid transport system substrate-binding protein
METDHALDSLFGRIFYGKPVSTFPENALALQHRGILMTKSLAAVGIAVLCGITPVHSQADNTATAPWVIGEIAILSGPAATVGTRLHKSFAMWVDQINSSGGIRGRKVELVTCDDQALPEKAVACARSAILSHAVVIVANTLTASVAAIAPLVADGPFVLVASPNVVPAPDTNLYQISPSDAALTRAIADYLKQNGLDGMGMVASTDASGEVGVTNVRRIFGELGLGVKIARIDLRANDASIQLAYVATPDIRLVYSNYSGGGAATVVKSYSNLDLRQPLLVSYANVSPAFVSLVKDVLPRRLLAITNRAVVPDLLPPAQREKVLRFSGEYAKTYNEEADTNNLIGKMSADVLQSVLTNVAEPADATSVKSYLESHPIETLQTLRFSSTTHVGLGAEDAVVVELKNGSWAKADPL